MRVGRNPYKGASGEGQAYTGKKVTVAMLTYIPNFIGYYRERFELLKLSLESMIAHTPHELADFLIFDNGSCEEVRAYLQQHHESGNITFFIQSKYNLGYNGALNYIYSCCQTEYLSYADDDVFFHPQWLEKALEIHENFPSVGMVSCCPSKSKFGENHEYSKSLSERFPLQVKIKYDASRWNEKWDALFLHSVGDYSVHPELLELNIPILESNGLECYPISTHFHYVLSKEAINYLYPFPVGDLMSSNFKNPAFNMHIIFDQKLDEGELAKVTTVGMYVEHLGNVWSERAEELKNQYGIRFNTKLSIHRKVVQYNWKQRLVFKFMNLPWISKLMYALYEVLFDQINAKNTFDKRRSAK